MDYTEWYNLLIKTTQSCGKSLLDSLYDNKYDDASFGNLIDVMEMDVKDISDTMKGRALFSAVMVSAFEVGNEQKKMIDKLIDKSKEQN